MNRRSWIAGAVGFVVGVLPAKAQTLTSGDRLCPLFRHHQFVFDRNELGPQGTSGQWYWEFSKCKCGAELRELVASPRG